VKATGVPLAILVSFLTVHTLFWIFNGHVFVLMRYISSRRNDPAKFISYIEKMHQRVNSNPFLLAVVAFGSLSKGGFSATSDFDVRFIRKRGFINSIRAFNLCSKERARAFFHAFPLDIYVFDLEEIQHKINPDEPPVIMSDPDGIISMYRKDKVDFHDFYRRFSEKFAGAGK
jgi:hypothetical protein